jgi:hypothetical protein
MKRHVELRRSSLSRSTKPIPKVNRRQHAARQKRRPKVTASVRRQMLEKYGHQCTYEMNLVHPVFGVWDHYRCTMTETLEVHHEHYKQTPADPLNGLRLLCRYHHHLLESQLRPWNAGRLGR